MRIVVTGSSSGIGQALTARLLAHGHHVWGLARSDQAAAVQRAGGTLRASRCDVANWSEVAAAARDVLAAWPELDALVTCAGTQGAIGRTAGIDPERWSATVRVNLDGTLFPIRAFFPGLQRAARRAKIICFSGGGATKARPNFSAYGAAKAAVVRLVETIAEEERATPLDINAVAPGAINTAMTQAVLEAGPAVAGEAEYQAAQRQLAGGQAGPDRALDLVEWLLAPASDGISGRLLSAPWDPWPDLARHREELAAGDIFTLRRITPADRGKSWA